MIDLPLLAGQANNINILSIIMEISMINFNEVLDTQDNVTLLAADKCSKLIADFIKIYRQNRERFYMLNNDEVFHSWEETEVLDFGVHLPTDQRWGSMTFYVAFCPKRGDFYYVNGEEVDFDGIVSNGSNRVSDEIMAVRAELLGAVKIVLGKIETLIKENTRKLEEVM